MEQNRIWCVEDETSIRDILIYTLKSCGFDAEGFEDGAAFWQAMNEAETKPDLVLLDIMLWQSDGLTILQQLRQNPDTAQIPVIMTTAKGRESDKVKAFEYGADDYLVKPFGMMEMVARIKAVLRRCQNAGSAEKKNSILALGDIRLDPSSHKAWLEKKEAEGKPGEDRRIELELSRKEFDLLALFLEHPRKAFSRDDLLYEVWKTDFAGETRTVDVHIRSLRSKLLWEGDRIETVRGIGYRMREDA